MNKLHSALLHAAPVAVTALYGAWWITAHTGGGRDSAHALWQSLALAETLLALLLRERKPAGALAGILAAYLAFDLDLLLLPGMLFALLTVATTRHCHVGDALRRSGTIELVIGGAAGLGLAAALLLILGRHTGKLALRAEAAYLGPLS